MSYNQRIAVRLEDGKTQLYKVSPPIDPEELRQATLSEVEGAKTVLVEVKEIQQEEEKEAA